MAESLTIGAVLPRLQAPEVDPVLVAWIERDLASIDLAVEGWVLQPPPGLPIDQCARLLRALCHLLVTDGPVVPDQLEGFREAARQLGFDEDWVEGMVLEELGIPLAEVWAAGALCLPPGADADAIKKAHRKLARDFHPDRVAHLADAFQELARTRTADVNRARDILLDLRAAAAASVDPVPEAGIDTVIEPVPDGDDVDLEPVSEEVRVRRNPPSLELELEWAYEDAPTEEDALTDVLESITDATDPRGGPPQTHQKRGPREPDE